jgi:hypothetical protein
MAKAAETNGKQHTASLVARPPIHTASFEKWNPDRRDEIFLYHEDEDDRENYRYKLTVLDDAHTVVSKRDNNQALATKKSTVFGYATAVFLIPVGRESEFVFHSISGLRTIATSARAARLIAVAFGRHHSFPSQAAVQEELAYVVQRLAAAQELPNQSQTVPESSGRNARSAGTITSSIPFMALDGIGDRNVLASGTSAISGRYLVEQCLISSAERSIQQWARRLYFLDGNPFVIQSQVMLHASSEKSTKDNGTLVVDKSVTAFNYHKCGKWLSRVLQQSQVFVLTVRSRSRSLASEWIVTAGIMTLLPDHQASGLLLGLGGGGLVNLWHYLRANWGITAVELDPCMPEIAATYFALDCNKLNVKIGDGLAVHCIGGTKAEASANTTDGEALPPVEGLGFEAESFDFIVIDVDSKDSGSGMSCPPAGFVQVSYLQRLLSLLRPDAGVLAINVSARDATAFLTTCKTVKDVFPTVFLSKRSHHSVDTSDALDLNEEDTEEEESDDLNVVVFATRRPSLLSQREMSDCIARCVQESQGMSNLDEILLSDLCQCVEDFAVWDGVEPTSTDSRKSNKKKAGSKRRTSKRSSNKKR